MSQAGPAGDDVAHEEIMAVGAGLAVSECQLTCSGLNRSATKKKVDGKYGGLKTSSKPPCLTRLSTSASPPGKETECRSLISRCHSKRSLSQRTAVLDIIL